MKVGTKIVLTVLAFILVSVSLSALIDYSIDEENSKFKVNIGKNVFMGADTLTVVNYSIIFEEYTLSDGSTVSYDYVCSSLICENQ